MGDVEPCARMHMEGPVVTKYDDWGNPYGEPPYTEEEEAEIYRATANVTAFTRPVRPAAPPAPKGPPLPRAPKPR